LKRMEGEGGTAGEEVPELRAGVGSKREPVDADGDAVCSMQVVVLERLCLVARAAADGPSGGIEEVVSDAMVVARVRLVVSADGGGGREARTDARQRKHSPLPK